MYPFFLLIDFPGLVFSCKTETSLLYWQNTGREICLCLFVRLSLCICMSVCLLVHILLSLFLFPLSVCLSVLIFFLFLFASLYFHSCLSVFLFLIVCLFFCFVSFLTLFVFCSTYDCKFFCKDFFWNGSPEEYKKSWTFLV